MTTYIEITHSRPGLHCWPDAPESRRFLRSSHRHQFHFRVKLQVFHDDREVEFFELKDVVAQSMSALPYDLGTRSCERIARYVGAAVYAKYGDQTQAPTRPQRRLEVQVSEDGENSAVVEWEWRVT